MKKGHGSQGWAVWVTGLPGSGKTSVATALVEGLRRRGFMAVHLSMDERRTYRCGIISTPRARSSGCEGCDKMRDMNFFSVYADERRKAYFPSPSYSAEERERAYSMFVEEAAFLVRGGKGVVMDASAHRRELRRRARRLIPRFAEIHLKCPVEEAMRREATRPEGLVMAGLYEKALDRKATGKDVPGLGVVPGVDEPFEEDEAAECVIDAGALPPEEVISRAQAFVFLWLMDHYG